MTIEDWRLQYGDGYIISHLYTQILMSVADILHVSPISEIKVAAMIFLAYNLKTIYDRNTILEMFLDNFSVHIRHLPVITSEAEINRAIEVIYDVTGVLGEARPIEEDPIITDENLMTALGEFKEKMGWR